MQCDSSCPLTHKATSHILAWAVLFAQLSLRQPLTFRSFEGHRPIVGRNNTHIFVKFEYGPCKPTVSLCIELIKLNMFLFCSRNTEALYLLATEGTYLPLRTSTQWESYSTRSPRTDSLFEGKLIPSANKTPSSARVLICGGLFFARQS